MSFSKEKEKRLKPERLALGKLRIYSEMQGHVHVQIIPGQTSRLDLTLTQTYRTKTALIHSMQPNPVSLSCVEALFTPQVRWEHPSKESERRESMWDPLLEAGEVT